jgi:RNA polymerase sigma-70 factor (sigma-E family)
MTSRRHLFSVSTERDFAEFYAATWPRLLRTTYVVAGDRQLAEDALQTAYAKAFAAWGRIARADDPVAYVRKMAVNASLAQHRKAFVRRELSVDLLPESAAAPAEDALLERDEVWVAVRDLPPRQRAVVVLRYYEDLSEQQIAEALRCRPGTVKSQASAALATLRARLGEVAPTHEGDRS